MENSQLRRSPRLTQTQSTYTRRALDCCEELSSIGTRQPKRVAALIYLDAAQQYSYHAGLPEDPAGALPEVRKKLGDLRIQKGFFEPPATLRAIYAIYAGEQEYTDIHAPVLAICAVPGNLAGIPKAAKATAAARKEAQVKAFETGVPSARVIRLPLAGHYIFQSNEKEGSTGRN